MAVTIRLLGNYDKSIGDSLEFENIMRYTTKEYALIVKGYYQVVKVWLPCVVKCVQISVK